MYYEIVNKVKYKIMFKKQSYLSSYDYLFEKTGADFIQCLQLYKLNCARFLNFYFHVKYIIKKIFLDNNYF